MFCQLLTCRAILEADYPAITSKAEAITKAKQPFERIVLTKEQVRASTCVVTPYAEIISYRLNESHLLA